MTPAQRAVPAGPRGPRLTQEELQEMQRLQAERGKVRLGQPREEPC